MISATMMVEAVNGKGKLMKPPMFTKDGTENKIRVHGIFAAPSSGQELVQVSCSAANYRSLGGKVKENVLAVFIPPAEKKDYICNTSDIWGTLISSSDTLYISLKDINNNYISSSCFVLVEIKGEVDNRLLL